MIKIFSKTYYIYISSILPDFVLWKLLRKYYIENKLRNFEENSSATTLHYYVLRCTSSELCSRILIKTNLLMQKKLWEILFIWYTIGGEFL